MQRMYPGDLAKLINENKAFPSLFLSRIRQLSLVDIIIEFSAKQNLFISLNNEAPFIVFNANTNDFPTGGELHSFVTDARHFLAGRLTAISQPQNDMILALEFTRKNTVFEEEKITLYLELIPRHPQAIITNENGVILAAFRYNQERGKDGRLIRRGEPYTLPSAVDEISTARHFKDDRLTTYLNEYGARIKKQNYRELYVYLEHNIKRLQRLILNFKKDLEKLESLPQLYERATLLLTEKPRIAGKYVEINGNLIKVNPRYNAVINAELMFKAAKKIKKSEVILTAKIDEVNERILYFKQVLNQLNSTNDIDDIAAIYDELNIIKTPKKKRPITKLMPYFITYENTVIYFGKNNKQNDHLTFKIARKNDTFMHIRNYPGAHIIISNPKPSNKVIEFAANLALFLSKKSDGEVTYTTVNEIKKGQHPGQVILRSEQTLFVRYDENLTAVFNHEIKRYS